mmetsp:Transcript_12160/g.21514  ORF Transcript_12160/g.21514 Transcript_12160/m.21514 type:complete len:243 (+) Transcript_12160:1026-1754(+)
MEHSSSLSHRQDRANPHSKATVRQGQGCNRSTHSRHVHHLQHAYASKELGWGRCLQLAHKGWAITQTLHRSHSLRKGSSPNETLRHPNSNNNSNRLPGYRQCASQAPILRPLGVEGAHGLQRSKQSRLQTSGRMTVMQITTRRDTTRLEKACGQLHPTKVCSSVIWWLWHSQVMMSRLTSQPQRQLRCKLSCLFRRCSVRCLAGARGWGSSETQNGCGMPGRAQKGSGRRQLLDVPIQGWHW